MLKITKKMKEILNKADLEKGVINDVPWRTMCGLEDRELITSAWHDSPISSGIITTTQGGTFPMFSRVKLTESGINTAKSIQSK